MVLRMVLYYREEKKSSAVTKSRAHSTFATATETNLFSFSLGKVGSTQYQDLLHQFLGRVRKRIEKILSEDPLGLGPPGFREGLLFKGCIYLKISE